MALIMQSRRNPGKLVVGYFKVTRFTDLSAVGNFRLKGIGSVAGIQ